MTLRRPHPILALVTLLACLVLPVWSQLGSSGDKGLTIHLSDGTAPRGGERPAPPAAATPLTGAGLAALLHRIPALHEALGDRQDFALRERSLPAPRTARTVAQTFPPAPDGSKPPTIAAGPLEVVHHAPDGDVPLAPFLSITFNQPMVPVSSVDDVANETVPVRLTPRPPGRWRWIGTKTMVYEPAPGINAVEVNTAQTSRFPMATSYKVEIPAGTRSLNGGKLAQAVSWSFRTPSATVSETYPGSDTPQGLHPMLFVAFNQAIDPAAVLKTIALHSGKETFPLQIASAERDKTVSEMARANPKNRWLAFEPVSALPKGTSFQVDIGPGTPSLEGPNPTRQASSFAFSTYGPLTIEDWTHETRPEGSFSVRFNNPIDARLFNPSTVKVTPELHDQLISVQDRVLYIRGRARGRTRYAITVPGSLTDSFGQTLGKDQTLQVDVGAADPSFQGPNESFIVPDPDGTPRLHCSVVNYRSLLVHAYAVKPEDWGSFAVYSRDVWRNPTTLKTPGHEVWKSEIPVPSLPDETQDLAIDLRPALPRGVGELVVTVEPLPRPTQNDRWRWGARPYVGWIEATHLGIDAMADGERMLVSTTNLADGKPLSGVEVELAGGNAVTARSDERGLADIPSPHRTIERIVARRGDDVAMLPRSASPWGNYGFAMTRETDALNWYVIDDRQTYRPGETARLKGWIRTEQHAPRGGITLNPAREISYRVSDSRGNNIGNGTVPVSALGGFDLSYELPKTVNLGRVSFYLTAVGAGVPGAATVHTVQAQEFRRPEFEVKTTAQPGTSRVGEGSDVSVDAHYYAGGGLADAEVDWMVTSSPTSYSPPGWSGFTFGTFTPWWRFDRWWRPRNDDNHAQSFQGHTDAAGIGRLHLDYASVDPPRPTEVTAQATVQDVNRQAWSSSTHVLVHPASVYVGLRSKRTFVEKGQPLSLDAIVTDLDGKAVVGKTVRVVAYQNDWVWGGGEVKTRRLHETSLTLTSAATPVAFSVPTVDGGTYQVEATVDDDRNRRNQSEMTVWVSGGKAPPTKGVQQESVTLIPSQKEYKPGDVAEILVQAPFAPAEVVVSQRRHGLVKTERMSLPTGSTTLKVPIEEGFTPNLEVQVDAVGSKVRTDANGEPIKGAAARPAYASGSLDLEIPPTRHQLAVTVKPDVAAAEPGAQTGVQVSLKDADGKPVQGEVALLMVDEAVLSLSGYDPADPLGVFWRHRPGDVTDAHNRQFVQLELKRPEPPPAPPMEMMRGGAVFASMAPGTARAKSAPASMIFQSVMRDSKDKESGAQTTPIALRLDFNPLALFVPAVKTGPDGLAHVPVKLPGNLTRYRLIALAAAGATDFGKAEGSLTARQPLMVRPSAPRFLNFGDHCELPVVLQNQTDHDMLVDVAARATNAHLEQGPPSRGAAGGVNGAGFQVRVKANDRCEVRFPCSADQAGTARFQFAASSGRWADAAQISFPVWTPATTEAFATYGVVDKGAIAQAVQAPSNVFPQFGGLEVTTSSTALAELTDAFLYLESYPFECSEQLSSRILATAALRDVLAAFKAPGLPSKSEIEAAMKRDLTRLGSLQNYDGGWDYWTRGKPSIPFPSLHVAHALVRARLKGYTVDDNVYRSSMQYVRTIESHIPSDYPPSCRWSLRAYAIYIARLAGEPELSKARALVREVGVERLQVESLGWLLPTLSKDEAGERIRKYLSRKVVETAATAQITTSYGDGAYLTLHSDRRDDAIVLEAMVSDTPGDPVIPKLVRGLLDHRTRGRWGSTQENCFVLLALDEYFQRFEHQTPDFVARLWLGQRFAGEQPFHGRSTDEKLVRVPMDQLKGREDLTIAKSGDAGRLYYRIGMSYAPRSLKLASSDNGFTVAREYEATEDNRDVKRGADGVWHIRAGATVKVTVTMVAPGRRYHVALVDPLPAGLEALNPALAVTGQTASVDSRRDWWTGHWFEHENLRDERVEAFTSLLWDGVYHYSYIARATTPGTFVVPPAKAEEMYHPETFGRSSSDVVEVR